MLRCVVVIPARYASSRFPGKPLASIAGRPMIQHVYERACRAQVADTVVVATDDDRVEAAVRAFGGDVVRTSPDHVTGTDRVAEVAAGMACDIVVNVQGDEPCIMPQVIDTLVQPLLTDTADVMATLAQPLSDVADLLSPHQPKVVIDRTGHALYFSRAPIPFHRQAWSQGPQMLVAEGVVPLIPPGCYRHYGLYAYRRAFLLELTALPQTPLEQVEQLEQLRALEYGYRIYVALTGHESVGVDVPEDIVLAERLLRRQRV